MSLTSFIKEKLIINKEYKSGVNITFTPKTFNDLYKEILARIKEQGGGTEKEPINLNDIDVSNITDFHNLFYYVNGPSYKVVAIDISEWDMKNAVTLSSMFNECIHLKYIGDISDWDISNVNDMHSMFSGCKKLRNVGDLSQWGTKVSNVNNFSCLFKGCEKMEPQDLDKWRVMSGLKRDNVKMLISGTTGWKMPSWARNLPVK